MSRRPTHLLRRTAVTGRRARLTHAFTLIELLLVLIIMGITSAMAVPRYANFMAQNHLDAAVRRITADLNYASAVAKHRSTTQKVNFDVAGNDYKLPGLNSLTHKTRGYKVQLGEEPYGATLVSADFSGVSEVTFDGYGRPDSGGTIVITVGTMTRTLTLSGTNVRQVTIVAQ